MKLAYASITLIILATSNAADDSRHLRHLSAWNEASLDCGDKKKVEVVVKGLTDNYPQEISWYITDDDSGKTISKGHSLPKGTFEDKAIVCEDHDYTFAMKDSYGDGMCCGHGNGFYELYLPDREETIIERDGEFKFDDTFALRVELKAEARMDPVPFDGWDGNECLEIDGKPLKNYKMKTGITMRKCMALACENKAWTGFDYIEGEDGKASVCKLIWTKKGVKYHEKEGAVCLMKKAYS